jgi:large subunit ribosomal protein L25
MSSKIKFELEAEVRQDIGRGASRRLRQNDKIPAVVYGAGEDAVSLILDHNKTKHAFANEGFYSHILTLKVGKKSEKVILKAMQRHPAKPRITHLDFLRVRADQKLQMQVPLHFIGEEDAPGLKEGGVISHHESSVEVSCLPANLPEFIEVDLSHLALNDSIHLSHLKLPEGVELVALVHGAEGRDAAVASLHIPRAVEEEIVAVEGEEGAAPEGEATEASAEDANSEENKD